MMYTILPVVFTPIRKLSRTNDDGLSACLRSTECCTWFDIAMNEMAFVNVFDSRDHLIDEHECRFQGELSLTVIEQILQRRAQ